MDDRQALPDDLIPLLDRLCRRSGLGALRGCLPLPGAAVNLAFRAETAHGGRVAIRVNLRDPDDPKWEREAAVYDLLHRVAPDLPVPAVLLTDASLRWVPWPVQVTTWIEGMPGDAAMVDRYLLPDAELGRLIWRLHAVPVPYFGWPRPPRGDDADRSWPAYVRALAQEGMAAAERSGLLTPWELAGIQRWLEGREAALAADGGGRPALVHSDLHWGNVLLAARGGALSIVGLVDFEWAVGAAPAFEWAWATRPVRHSPAVRSAYRACGGQAPDARRQSVYRVLQSLTMIGAASRRWPPGHPAREGHLRILRTVAMGARCGSDGG